MYIQKYRHFNVPSIKLFYQKKNCKANGMYFWISMYCHAEPVDKSWEMPILPNLAEIYACGSSEIFNFLSTCSPRQY